MDLTFLKMNSAVRCFLTRESSALWQITSLVKNTSLALLSALLLYLNFRRKLLHHRNVGICWNPVFWLSKWGQSCWTQYLCQVNYLVAWCAFGGKPNTTKKRMLVCAYFRCQCTPALIYHTVQLTAVSNHHIAGLSHDLFHETRDTNCHCSHLATVCPPAEANGGVKPINFSCCWGVSVGLSQQKPSHKARVQCSGDSPISCSLALAFRLTRTSCRDTPRCYGLTRHSMTIN